MYLIKYPAIVFLVTGIAYLKSANLEQLILYLILQK